MDEVRIGVIGCGGMARSHMGYFDSIPGLRFTACSDVDPETVAQVVEQYGVEGFDAGEKLLDSGLVDAVLIATPHYFHPDLSIAAMEQGVHVLVEKPVAVTAGEAQRVNDASAKHPDVIYAAMFQQRVSPIYAEAKKLLGEGVIGELVRFNWIVTTWLRTQAYFDSGGWRATWGGEGGGVLMNQCPHNLDMLCWLVGTPARTRAFLGFGKHHNIEVEDEVHAYLEWSNGATGVFITSTAEAPGTNRLELVGTHGTMIIEPGKPIRLSRLHTDSVTHIRESQERFAAPPSTVHEVTPPNVPGGHREITANFVDAVRARDSGMLLAPAEQGIWSVELANAMIASAWNDATVEIPMDRAAFAAQLQEKIDSSTFRKPDVRKRDEDLSKSF